MKPIQITLNGFMSFRHEQTIPFSGMTMTAVTGTNGHGKSSIILGVAWALFGQTRVDGDRDSIINDHEDAAEVTLDFEDASGQSWRVRRVRYYQGSQTLTLQSYDEESGQWLDIGDHTIKEAQQKLYEVTMLDEDSFYSLMAIEQNSIAGGTRFTAANSNWRRTILMSLLPELDIYGELEAEAGDVHRNFKDKLSASYAVEETLESRVEGLKTKVQSMEERVANSKDPDELRKKIEQNNEVIERTQKLIDAQDNGRAEVAALLDAARSERRAKEAEVQARTQALRSELKEVKTISSQIEEREEELEASKAKLDEHSESIAASRKTITDLGDSVDEAEKRAARLAEELAAADERLTLTSARASETEAAVDALKIQHEHSGAGKCLVCESALTDDRISELLLKAEQDQRTADDDMEAARSSRRALNRKLSDANDELTSIQQKLRREGENVARWEDDIERIALSMEQAREKIKEAEKVAAGMRSSRAIRGDIGSLEEIEVSEKETELKGKLEGMDEGNEHVKLISDMQSDNRVTQSAIEGCMSDRVLLKDLAAQLEEAESTLKQNAEDSIKLADEVDTAQIVREACQQKGIPSMLIREVLQSIEDRQNELLQRIMGEGAVSVEFRQERELKSRDGSKSVLDIIVRTPDGFERPIESFSGGERVRLTMSNLFAMVQVFNERTPGLIRTLWLDEPFGALDTNSLPIMVDIIRDAIDKEIVESVFVVTHQAEVSDAMPQNMIVVKDPEAMSSVVEII